MQHAGFLKGEYIMLQVTYHFDLLDPHPDEKSNFYGPLVSVRYTVGHD